MTLVIPFDTGDIMWFQHVTDITEHVIRMKHILVTFWMFKGLVFLKNLEKIFFDTGVVSGES